MLLALTAFLALTFHTALDNGDKVGSIAGGLIATLGFIWVIGWATYSWWRGTLKIEPRISNNYALLDVTNSSRSDVTVRAEAKIIAPPVDDEEYYSVQWREREEYEISLHPNGGHHILNVAEASMPNASLRYTSFTFLTAKLPLREGKYSESFSRHQEKDYGFVLRVSFTTGPVLRGTTTRHYQLRAQDEGGFLLVRVRDPEHPTEDEFRTAMQTEKPIPLISFEEISSSRASEIGR